MLYSTKGNIVAVIAKDYHQHKIITRVYDCSRPKPKLRTQSERKSISKAKDYLYRKFHFEDFNCLAPITFIVRKDQKNLLEKVKENCRDLLTS